ncbi:MAG: PHB depolymerase family esterase [Polaromonas sp.]|uniref:extracellular catalytic domain type 1 short-chain-length polyhydroxyalkanoate depolymerase n=1 Tax=Polaromonas sp. TaxID=1869339 RepID=UPI002731D77C|nr:PHB depolymerase family esterase [Polaromonas sp.]MDP1739558.1 PHB depolymerase family esterase [Polaromonas sp.]MDP3354716.1 PHB depolymerase family esterase [Polaromonas sp.]
MAKSLSSLWLKSVRRMGRAQQAQGRRLLQSLVPKPVRAPAAQVARRIKSSKVATSVRKPRALPEVPGSWQKAWFSASDAGELAPARMAYWLYLPASAGQSPLPLVVMLHGCQQSPTDFAASTRMNQLAERKGFAVLYPQQSGDADSHRCWHWYKRQTQQGGGDVQRVAGLIAHVQRKHALDRSRSYIAGLSAGAALATLVALHHPEHIAALGIHSAPVFGTADSPVSAYRAMQHGTRLAHIAAAHAVAHSQPQFPGMPAIILHGDRDAVVRRINAAQLFDQLKVLNAPLLGSALPVLRSYPGRSGGRRPRHAYTSASVYAGRKPQLVCCEIAGLGHAWSGGAGQLAFSAPEGPDASLMLWTFFARHHRPRATQLPDAMPDAAPSP